MDRFDLFEELRREMDQLFDSFAVNAPLYQFELRPRGAAREYPLVNISEDTDNLYVEGMSPGLALDKLDVSVVQNSLTISGEKPPADPEIKPEAYHRNERLAGRFSRTIDLPVEVNPENVKAEYRNGLLLITLPKSEKAKPRRIQITSG